MLRKLISIGVHSDLKKSLKFRIRLLNSIAIGTIITVSIYSLTYFFGIFPAPYVIPLFGYLFTSLFILGFNYFHKYDASVYSLNILFPISFIMSSVQLGNQLDVEYFLYLTGVGVLFFTYSFKSLTRRYLFFFNLILFVLLKVYMIYYPKGLLEIDETVSPYFDLLSGVLIFILLYVLLSIAFNNNSKLVEKLRYITENQEKTIADRTIELKNKSNDLERYINELERFSYISAHDLREPLRSIKGFAQLLKKEIEVGKTENIKEYVEFIEKGVDRLDVLTTDIVKYVDVEPLINQRTNINTEKIIRKIISNINQPVDIDYNQALPILYINKKLGYYLFENIIINAVEYCDKPIPKIIINVKSDSQFYHFSIQDNGVGIPKAYHDLIFEMFKRLDNNFRKTGSGIGLAICKKIVEAHNGKIWVESEIGLGSTFHFTIKR